MKKYLSELMQGVPLDKNTLIISPVGSGKTFYILNDLCKQDKKVLYLCDNSNLEEQVLLSDRTTGDKKKISKKGFGEEITVMTYKSFGLKVKYDSKDTFINSFDMIVADEIHNLVDYQTFNDDSDLAIAIVKLVNKYEGTQIIMFTATPYYLDELAKKNESFGRDFIRLDFSKSKEIKRYINKRKAYLSHISQIQFVLKEYRESFEYASMKCLIYVNTIEDMKFVEEMSLHRNLKPICIWSIHNEKHTMSQEQLKVRNHLLETGELFGVYNVLIINRAMETGVNIYDEKMQLVIVNTTNKTQQIQARGRVRHDVDLLVMKTNKSEQVNTITLNEESLDKYLLKVDLENFIKIYGLKDEFRRFLSVNKFIEMLSNNNYKVTKSRRMVGGKQNTYYKIIKIKIDSNK